MSTELRRQGTHVIAQEISLLQEAYPIKNPRQPVREVFIKKNMKNVWTKK